MKIFLDTASVEAIKKYNDMGLVDGITTNPTLLSKEKGNPAEIMREIVRIVQGPVSLEVVATTAEEMIEEAHRLKKYGRNVVVKIPMIPDGLKAVKKLKAEGIETNVTLCFSANQAILAAKAGAAYVSPFIGRLDDHGQNGVDVIRNIKRMYTQGDGHALILAASIRNLQHLLYCFSARAELVTVPAHVLEEWAAKGFPLPDAEFTYQKVGKSIPYEELDLQQPWQRFNTEHELTTKGIEKFVADYRATLYQAAS